MIALKVLLGDLDKDLNDDKKLSDKLNGLILHISTFQYFEDSHIMSLST